MEQLKSLLWRINYKVFEAEEREKVDVQVY